ncbi:YceI family protein [bacterium]|nr:YceI family protein [bacterium]
MKRFKLIPIAFALAFLIQSGFAADWTVDKAHSQVGFAVKHLMISTVRGSFSDYEVAINFDETDPSNLSFSGTIQAASINTENEKRDTHLRSADFFDVANYPTLTFASKKTEKISAGMYKMTGDLTIHGITKEVVLNVEGLTPVITTPMGDTRTGVTVTTTINRKDFGLNWNKALETGGVLVADEVKITIEAELVKGN